MYFVKSIESTSGAILAIRYEINAIPDDIPIACEGLPFNVPIITANMPKVIPNKNRLKQIDNKPINETS